MGTYTIKGNFHTESRRKALLGLCFRYINIRLALQLHAQKAMPSHPVTDNQTQARTHMVNTQDEDRREHIMCLLISAALFGPFCEHRSTQSREHTSKIQLAYTDIHAPTQLLDEDTCTTLENITAGSNANVLKPKRLNTSIANDSLKDIYHCS